MRSDLGEGGIEPAAGKTEPPGSKTTEEDAEIAEIRQDLVRAGRAFEAGELDEAQRLCADARDWDEALLLRSRIAEAQGDHDAAVRHLRAVKTEHPALRELIAKELAQALARSGRYDEALAALEPLLAASGQGDAQEYLDLLELKAKWLLSAGEKEASAHAYAQAMAQTADTAVQERLAFGRFDALVAAGKSAEARELLEPLVRKAQNARYMRNAEKALKRIDVKVRWTAYQKVDRARVFTDLRAWDDAIALLDPLVKSNNKKIASEALWLKALVMYKRRRHYSEAIPLFEKVIAQGGEHADEARFYAARALSRLDRDEEAIRAYRRYAASAKDRARATEARFLAARLEFFLGKHQRSLNAFDRLLRRPGLGPGRTRDASFMAGLLCHLLKKPARAKAFLLAASKGTSNEEVLERNRYWIAVVRAQIDKKDGKEALQQICADDPTTWYARLAAVRLFQMGADQGPCNLAPLADEASQQKLKPLEKLSVAAAFLARAGLFRQAAAELRAAERSGQIEAEAQDWVAAYNALDAPHHAIRRASIGLRWPPGTGQRWRALAAYPTPHRELVEEVQKQQRLPPFLIYAVARKESLFDPYAVSGAGALGMMQMMPRTYEKNRKLAGLEPLKNGDLPGPTESIRAGSIELAALLDRFSGSLPLALMAYNAGTGAVSRWLERSGDLPTDVFVEKAGFAQTRNYVKRVYKNLVRYRLLAGELPPDLPLVAKRPDPEKP